MQIWYSHYSLQPKYFLNAKMNRTDAQYPSMHLNNESQSEKIKFHEGVLLKIEWKNDLVGYADCHPWPELGDLPLVDQLVLLKQDKFTEITKQSLFFANVDAIARAEKRSLFDQSEIPLSHLTVADVLQLNIEELIQAKNDGFTSVKLKLGHSLSDEHRAICRLLRSQSIVSDLNLGWRFDFNGSLTEMQLREFYSSLPIYIQEAVEFIEDPVPFSFIEWSALNYWTKHKLAIDRDCEKILQAPSQVFPFSTVVVKPASQEFEKVSEKCLKLEKKVVVTSSMDHPLGQMSAAWAAVKMKEKLGNYFLGCGLLTHGLYESNPFSEQIICNGPKLIATEGTGFGFDSLLEKLDWQKL